LILTGFLGGRFAQDKPLSLSASIAFEQSYEGIDGDSASSTELYALLSSLADLPIRFLKIEGWMVARAVGDSRIRQLLETIVVTARKFRLTTVAECVEDAGTASVLRDLGVDWAQGYLYGAPVVDRRSGAARSAGAGAG
jgi:predicted signal transduction protein with EAL and GGDEF domain